MRASSLYRMLELVLLHHLLMTFIDANHPICAVMYGAVVLIVTTDHEDV